MSVAFCTFSGIASAEALLAKELSGPASEFNELKPADGLQSAIHSKSALLPVYLDADGRAVVDMPVAAEQFRFIVLNGGADWSMQIRRPGARSASPVELAASEINNASFGIEAASHQSTYYGFVGAERGTWQLEIQSNDRASQKGFVLLEGDSATQLVSYRNANGQVVGNSVSILASLSSQNGGDLALGKGAANVASANVRLTAPDGSERTLSMFDDGRSGDGRAADGTFGARFQAEQVGNYQAQVLVRGSDLSGNAIARSAEHVIPVAEQTLRLSGTTGSMVQRSGTRIAIQIPVSTDLQDQHYRGYAEVWGVGRNGEAVAVAWVGGMVQPENGAVSFGFDTRWASLANASAPFELRNVRFENPDNYVSIATAARISLAGQASLVGAKNLGSVQIDESMLMGERPAELLAKRGTGARLLLVHGYCSGGVWPTANFSSASTFLDTNQNRSHDQFARLLQTFGNTWNSFGVVAHSQGGAASLHLFTYYWSGLDKAVGSRLIQSVGTPYQGTNLSGILAALGNWFGVGCGTNNDLTYSGASSWLAGIPTSRRAKVNYYTTSFRTTNWWTNDFCQVATDLVLSDPEDGTTEQAKGQLSGAVNRGNTTGQCHTDNMRDPAQYRDAGRNGVMNTNAAR